MSIVLVGGMARLERRYRSEAAQFGIKLTLFDQERAGLATSIKNQDAVVVFSNKVSLRCRKKVLAIARKNEIPVFIFDSCGPCIFQECSHCLLLINAGGSKSC